MTHLLTPITTDARGQVVQQYRPTWPCLAPLYSFSSSMCMRASWTASCDRSLHVQLPRHPAVSPLQPQTCWETCWTSARRRSHPPQLRRSRHSHSRSSLHLPMVRPLPSLRCTTLGHCSGSTDRREDGAWPDLSPHYDRVFVQGFQTFWAAWVSWTLAARLRRSQHSRRRSTMTPLLLRSLSRLLQLRRSPCHCCSRLARARGSPYWAA